MVLAYSEPLRGIEACTLADARQLHEGVHDQRRKGSRDSVTEWEDATTAAWDELIPSRSAIWNHDGRNFAVPFRPEHRVLLVEQTGNPMAESSLESSWQRLITMAMHEGVIEKQDRFSLHGLKHRGVTDTVGNRSDKQDAAGHQSAITTGRYGHALPVVKPPRRR
ncbi:integrase [Stenotrophomonas sp. SORGH_AS_0321]|uniref:integrase n=1 Tax=Stenotrophomonas sp. SORGH_AS_0321 TaxID=3041787 RepID=UPI00286C6014|nr:integrase [Stenotrophomonas sp. SORGH_AS_0321]